MEKKVPKSIKVKRVLLSTHFIKSQNQVIEYGAEQFGYSLALNLDIGIEKRVQSLSKLYEFYPENRFLPTKTRIYRNIILGKYMILNRIKPTVIEVLAMYHSSISPSQIKEFRRIKT